MKKVSVITVNYNNKEGLRKTIQSVIHQVGIDFEYIIIDGGSTDGSVEVIKEYANRIDYWVSEKDKGIYHAMNKGLVKATGDYCNFMNSGDSFHGKDILEKICKYDEDLITGNAYSSKINQTFTYKENMSLFDLCTLGFNHQATFFKTKLFEGNLYDENLRIMADWKIVLQSVVLNQCSFRYVNMTVADYDLTGFSSLNKHLAEEEKKQILREFFPERVCVDYERFSEMKTPIVDYLPYLSKTGLLHKLVIKIIQIFIGIHKSFKGKSSN